LNISIVKDVLFFSFIFKCQKSVWTFSKDSCCRHIVIIFYYQWHPWLQYYKDGKSDNDWYTSRLSFSDSWLLIEIVSSLNIKNICTIFFCRLYLTATNDENTGIGIVILLFMSRLVYIALSVTYSFVGSIL